MKNYTITLLLLCLAIFTQAQSPAIEIVNCKSTSVANEKIYIVTAIGTSTLTYQWYCDGTAMEGENTNKLIVDASNHQNGAFYCLISNEKEHVSMASPLAFFRTHLDGHNVYAQKSGQLNKTKRLLAVR